MYKNSIFKRIFSFVMCVALLAGMIPTFMASVSAEELTAAGITTLQNQSFEEIDTATGEIKGWSAWGAKSHEQSSDRFTDGGYSLKLIDLASDGVVATQSDKIAVTAGNVYEATVDCWSESGVTGELYLQFWDAAGKRLAVPLAGNNGNGNWSKIKVTGTAPAGTVTASLMMVSGKVQIGTIYFDNTTFNEVNNITYNLTLKNPSFEDGLDETQRIISWKKLNTGDNVELVTDNASDGMYAVRLINNKAGCGLRSEPIKAAAEQEYEVKFSSYNQEGKSVVYLEFWDANGVRLKPVSILENAVAGQQRELALQGKAPVGTVYATILLYQDSVNIGTAYFDNIRFSVYDPIATVREFPIKEAEHPRMFFTKTELPSYITKAEDNEESVFGTSGKQAFDAIKAAADAYLLENSFDISYYGGLVVTYPLPPVQPEPRPAPPGFSGAYPYWTAMGDALQDRLQVLSLAYVITKNEVYANKAIEYAMSMTGWQVWSDPVYAAAGNEISCLDTAHITLGMSAVYDMLYDMLSADQRYKIKNALVTKGLEPLYTDTGKKVDHNIQMLRAAALGSGGAVLLGESENANKYLSRATDFYKWYLDERMTSGQQEGFLYTSYAIDTLIGSMDQIARVTGEMDLLQHPFFDFFVKWVVNFTAPGSGTLPAFSDSNEAAYFYPTMSIVNKWRENGYAGWYLANSKPAGSLMETFLYSNKQGKITSPESLGNSVLLKEIGWTGMRTGWSAEDTLFAMNSNTSTLGHNHYDQNSFQIATNGIWMASDPGYADFSAGTPKNEFTMKMGHNTILVDGIAQTTKGKGMLTEKIFTPNYSYVVGSAGQAYTGLDINLFDRHAILMNHKTNPYYIVMDNLSASNHKTYTWNFYTGLWNQLAVNGNPMVVGSKSEGNSIALRKGSSNLYIQFAGAQPLDIENGYYRTSEGPRIMVSNKEKASDYRFMAVINTDKATDNEIFATNILKTATTNNNGEIKTVVVSGTPAVFFRAAKAGDAVTFKFDVKKTDNYDVDIQMINSTAYGQYQMYIDEVPYGGVYEGYASEVKLAEPHNLGKMDLTEGQHTLKLECVGKNPASANFLIGMVSIKLKDENYNENAEIKKSDVEIVSDIVSDSVLGAKLKYNSNQYDVVLFNKKSGEIEGEGINSDAAQISLSGIENSKIGEGFSIIDGKNLSYVNQNLLSSDNNMSAYFDYSQQNMIFGYTNTNAECHVMLYAGDTGISQVLIGGNAAPYTYDANSKMVSITVPAGKQNVSVYQTVQVTPNPITPVPVEDPEPTDDITVDFENGSVIIPVEALKKLGTSDVSKIKLSVVDEATGNGFKLKVVARYNDKEAEIGDLSSYITAKIHVTPGVTVVVYVTADGREIPVPTKIITENGKAYALIHTLATGDFKLSGGSTVVDVDKSWAKDYVNTLAGKLIVRGNERSEYCLEKNITRAEFAVIMQNALGLVKGGNNTFLDVKKDDWYFNAMMSAVEYGLMQGYNDGHLGAADTLTREQAMVILSRALNIMKIEITANTEVLAKFADVNGIADWAMADAAKLVSAGIIEGSGGMIHAKDCITKAEVAKIVVEFLKLAKLD